MRRPLELTGALLRKAFEANLEAPGDLPTIEEAIGLPREDCAVVLSALDFLAGKLDQVEKVQVFDPNDPEGDGIYFEGHDFLVEWSEKKRKSSRKKVPPLVKVVKKGEPKEEAPRLEPKPAYPSSPPKRDLPIGRGLFSSAGKRDSPKPGVLPVPATEQRAVVPGFQPMAERFDRVESEPQASARGDGETLASDAPRGEQEQEALPPIQQLGPETPDESAEETDATAGDHGQEPEAKDEPATEIRKERRGFGHKSFEEEPSEPKAFGERQRSEGGNRPAFQGRRPGGGFRNDRPGFGDKPRFQGDRPRFQGKPGERRPFGDKPRFQGDRPRFQGKPGERRPFGDKPRFQGDRPKFQGKPGERRPFGDKPRFQGDRPKFQGKPGERRPFSDKPRFQGDRPKFQGKPGERRPFSDKPRFQGDRPKFQGKPGERRPFSDKPRFQGDRPRFQGKPGERRPFNDKPGFQGDRPRFQGKPGERRPFNDKPGFQGDRPRFQGKPGGEFRRDRPGFGDQRKPGFQGRPGEERRGPPPWKKHGDRPRFDSAKPFKKFGKPGGGHFGKGGPKGGKR